MSDQRTEAKQPITHDSRVEAARARNARHFERKSMNTDEIKNLINTCDLVPNKDTTNRLLEISAKLLDRVLTLEFELKATQGDLARAIYRLEQKC